MILACIHFTCVSFPPSEVDLLHELSQDIFCHLALPSEYNVLREVGSYYQPKNVFVYKVKEPEARPIMLPYTTPI